MDNLTAFQRDLLYVIAGHESSSGLALKKALQQYYSAEINHGRLYPNLDHHADAGNVEKGRLDDRTNSYTLTTKGKALLTDRRGWENRYLSRQLDGIAPTTPVQQHYNP